MNNPPLRNLILLTILSWNKRISRTGILTQLLIALFLSSACGNGLQIADTPNVPSEVSGTEPAGDDVEESVITLAPGPSETLMAPDELDRLLVDSEEEQARRARLVEYAIEPVINDRRVLEAMSNVPRHSFVPTDLLGQAYNDYPLPIGYGQTISQPSLVAQMTELLRLAPDDRVLEIGTGSGYQAAVLGEITPNVYSVEIIPELAGIAHEILDQLGYDTIEVSRRDGYFGWEEYAPFDAIIVTAAPDHLPQPLVQQLSPDGGRMVIPIGPVGNVQALWLVIKNGDEVTMERLMPVRFVPFTREGD